MYKILIYLVICIFLAGCATTSIIKEPIKTEHEFNVSQDVLWAELIDIIAEKGFVIHNIDKSSSIISITKKINKAEISRYSDAVLNEPVWPIGVMGAHYGAGKLRVTLNVKKIEDNKSALIIYTRMPVEVHTVFGERASVLMSGDVDQELDSNGSFEKSIIDDLNNRLPMLRN